MAYGLLVRNKKDYMNSRQQKKELQRYQNCLLYITVKDNNIEKALSLFKRKVKNSGLLKELRDREFYEKPSIKRRRRNKMKKLRNKFSD